MVEEARKVLYRLHNSGHLAYLVGGAVRDLLLERTPKDYDVATDARPDQIRKLFVNSRLIGRRFRLAHVFFRGGTTIEVSTFRKSPEPPGNGEGDAEPDQEGEPDLLIREDNTWGTPQEDAYRRDFTINALFYNIADFSVIDYVGGLRDLTEGIIRTIGDAGVRFREDPVRMIRAVEYAARLDFTPTPEIEKALRRYRKELRKASDARVADELLNLLRSGSAGPAFRQLWQYGLLEILHPELHTALSGDQGERFFAELAVIDRWQSDGRQVNDTILWAALISAPLRVRIARAESKKGGRLAKGEMLEQIELVLAEGQTLYRIPNRRRHQMGQALLAVTKLRRHPGRQRGLRSLMDRAYFPDALTLFTLEVDATGTYRNVLEEWQKISDQDGRSRKGERRSGGRGRDRGKQGGKSRRDGQKKRDSGSSRQRDDRRSPGGGDRKEEQAEDRRSRDAREHKREDSGDRRQRDGRHSREESDRKREESRVQKPPRDERPPETAERKTREEKPRDEPVAKPMTEPQSGEPVITPVAGDDIEHGRTTRDNRTWAGVAGQQSAVIRDMKKAIDAGEMTLPPAEEIPYVVPGQSVKETSRDWEENVGKSEEMAADESVPEEKKWGRTRRPSPPRL